MESEITTISGLALTVNADYLFKTRARRNPASVGTRRRFIVRIPPLRARLDGRRFVVVRVAESASVTAVRLSPARGFLPTPDFSGTLLAPDLDIHFAGQPA